jgi:hypothetical protein
MDPKNTSDNDEDNDPSKRQLTLFEEFGYGMCISCAGVKMLIVGMTDVFSRS